MLSTIEHKNYIDVTNEYLKNARLHKGKIIKAKYFKAKDNNKYYVDNKYVKINTSKRELEVAQIICNVFKSNVYLVPKVDYPKNIKTADYYSKKEYWDLKEIKSNGIRNIDNKNFSNLCDLLFPGYYQLLDENNFILGLEIFRKYYHPENVLNKKQSQFVNEIDKLARKLGHKGAGIKLANKIYTLAQKTISPYPNNQYTQLSAESCVETLILTIKGSKTIITEMDKLARELPEYEVINEMPGCGKRLTVRIIAEIGDIRRFKNAGSIIAYSGIDVPPYQSGTFELTSGHITKRGNKYLRKTGYEVMKSIKSSCKSGDELYDYIVKKENEGKLKKVAKIAGLNKFLRMYYGKVKSKYKELEIW